MLILWFCFFSAFFWEHAFGFLRAVLVHEFVLFNMQLGKMIRAILFPIGIWWAYPSMALLCQPVALFSYFLNFRFYFPLCFCSPCSRFWKLTVNEWDKILSFWIKVGALFICFGDCWAFLLYIAEPTYILSCFRFCNTKGCLWNPTLEYNNFFSLKVLR